MPNMFGCGTGRLTKKEIKARNVAARKHGAEFHFVHGQSGHCECGRGCRLDTCPVLHWWYSHPENLGEPFDRMTASRVLDEVETALAASC